MFNFRTIGEGSIQVGPLPPKKDKSATAAQKLEEEIAVQIEHFAAEPGKAKSIQSKDLLQIITVLQKEKPGAKEAAVFKTPGVSAGEIKKQLYFDHALNDYFNHDFSKPGPMTIKKHKNHDELVKRYLEPNRSLELIKNSFNDSHSEELMKAVLVNFEKKSRNVKKMIEALDKPEKKAERQAMIEMQKKAAETDFKTLAELRKRNNPALNQSVILLESKMIEAAQQYMTKAEVEKILSPEQKNSHATLLAKYQEPRTIEEKNNPASGGIVIKVERGQPTDKPLSKVDLKLTDKEVEQILDDLVEAIAVQEAKQEMEEASAQPAQPIPEGQEIETHQIKIDLKGIFEKITPASLKKLEEIVTPPSSKENSKTEKSSPKNQMPLFNVQNQTQFLKTTVSVLKSLSVIAAKKTVKLATQKEIKKTEAEFLESTVSKEKDPFAFTFTRPMPVSSDPARRMPQSQQTLETGTNLTENLVILMKKSAEQNKNLAAEISRLSQSLKISPEKLMQAMAHFVGALTTKDTLQKEKNDKNAPVSKKPKDNVIQSITKNFTK